mmetsp:Transcript_37785/g.60543  ORF Transcript_37785/g.60543 Transcript_37785/m.60543 type:complete len:346 (+) Transcript_37785:216-1253(+)
MTSRCKLLIASRKKHKQSIHTKQTVATTHNYYARSNQSVTSHPRTISISYSDGKQSMEENQLCLEFIFATFCKLLSTLHLQHCLIFIQLHLQLLDLLLVILDAIQLIVWIADGEHIDGTLKRIQTRALLGVLWHGQHVLVAQVLSVQMDAFRLHHLVLRVPAHRHTNIDAALFAETRDIHKLHTIRAFNAAEHEHRNQRHRLLLRHEFAALVDKHRLRHRVRHSLLVLHSVQHLQLVPVGRVHPPLSVGCAQQEISDFFCIANQLTHIHTIAANRLWHASMQCSGVFLVDLLCGEQSMQHSPLIATHSLARFLSLRDTIQPVATHFVMEIKVENAICAATKIHSV